MNLHKLVALGGVLLVDGDELGAGKVSVEFVCKKPLILVLLIARTQMLEGNQGDFKRT